MRPRPLPKQVNPALLEHAEQRRRSWENRLADQIRTQIQTMIEELLGRRRSPVLSAFLG